MTASPKALDGRVEQILAAQAKKYPYDTWHPNVILVKDTKSKRQRTVDIDYARNPRENECRTFTIEQMLGEKQRYTFSKNFVETIDKVWRTEKFLKVEGIAAYCIDSEEEAEDLNFNNLYYLAQDYIYEALGQLFDQVEQEKKQIMANVRPRTKKVFTSQSNTQPKEPNMSQHRDAIPPPRPATKPEPIEERPAAFNPFETTEENPEPRRAIPPPRDDDAPESNEILTSVLLAPDPVIIVQDDPHRPETDPREKEYVNRFANAKLHVTKSSATSSPATIVDDRPSNKSLLVAALVTGCFIALIALGSWYQTRDSRIAQTAATATPTMVAPTIVPTALPVVPDVLPVAGMQLPMSSEALEKYFGQKDPKHYDQSRKSTYSGPAKPRLVSKVDCPENQDGTVDVSQAEIHFR